MARLALILLIAAGCSSTPQFTPGGGGDTGEGGSNGGATGTTGAAGTTAGTSGSVLGSASLSGGFAIGSAYTTVAPDAGVGSSVTVLLFAAADTCSEAIVATPISSTSLIEISVSATPIVAQGSYNVAQPVAGQSASVAVNIGLADGGQSHYTASGGMVEFNEVDGTDVSGILTNVSFASLADGGIYPAISGSFSSNFCPGLP